MRKIFLLSIPFVLILFFIAGCGSKSDDKTSQVNVFFNAAKDAGPIFTPDRSKITKAAWGDTTGGLGKPIYEIFLMFRDYDPALDTGPGSSVGLNNIYKFIYQAGQFFNECDSDGTSVTATAFTSPFNFGRSDTYNKYFVRASYFVI